MKRFFTVLVMLLTVVVANAVERCVVDYVHIYTDRGSVEVRTTNGAFITVFQRERAYSAVCGLRNGDIIEYESFSGEITYLRKVGRVQQTRPNGGVAVTGNGYYGGGSYYGGGYYGGYGSISGYVGGKNGGVSVDIPIGGLVEVATNAIANGIANRQARKAAAREAQQTTVQTRTVVAQPTATRTTTTTTTSTPATTPAKVVKGNGYTIDLTGLM